MKKQERTARGKLIGAMTIFGTVGIFRKFIPMSSAVVAMVRGLVGVLFLLAVKHYVSMILLHLPS